MTLVLKNAVLIDGTGELPMEGVSVVVEGERIKEVISGPPGVLPSGTEVIDCRGQTLLPGLIDAHVHVGAVDARTADQHRRYFPSEIVVRTLNIMAGILSQGFTTVRDAGGADPGFREVVRQGLVPGPRMFVSGQSLSQTGGHGDIRLPAERHEPEMNFVGMAKIVADGVDEVRRQARDQLRQGIDWLKVHACGGCMSPADEIDSTQYSLEELKAAVWEAEAQGKYVMAHTYSSRSIVNCLKAGIKSLEHGNLLDETAAIAIKEAGAYLVPTLATYEMLFRLGKDLGVPQNSIRKINLAREQGLDALFIAHRIGVKIASGSDLLGPMHRFNGLELELKAKVMGAMGAIVATTKTNAELLREENNLGTIEAGKLADLIVVDGDPLKNIKIFQEYEDKITLIMQNGILQKNKIGS
jgi:imidazolonepropionase-like amidohydrolase